MFTTATDANKVMSQGLIVKYDAEPVLHVANNVSYTVAWKLTRTATQSYSYVGMTKAAAESCSETLRTNFTRKYMDFECDVVENEKDALKPNVIISPAFVWKCSTAIAPTHTDGEMYQIDISVSDVDVVYTTDQVTDAADLEGLFQAAAARDTPAGTDHIEITTATWDSSSERIKIEYSASITNFSANNLSAEIWDSDNSVWVATPLVNRGTVGKAQLADIDENKKFRLVYGSGSSAIYSPAYKTTDSEALTANIRTARYSVVADGPLRYARIVFECTCDLDPRVCTLNVRPPNSERAQTFSLGSSGIVSEYFSGIGTVYTITVSTLGGMIMTSEGLLIKMTNANSTAHQQLGTLKCNEFAINQEGYLNIDSATVDTATRQITCVLSTDLDDSVVVSKGFVAYGYFKILDAGNQSIISERTSRQLTVVSTTKTNDKWTVVVKPTEGAVENHNQYFLGDLDFLATRDDGYEFLTFVSHVEWPEYKTSTSTFELVIPDSVSTETGRTLKLQGTTTLGAGTATLWWTGAEAVTSATPTPRDVVFASVGTKKMTLAGYVTALTGNWIDNEASTAYSYVKKIAFGETITEIGAGSFASLTGLTEFSAGKATTIGATAFSGCTALTKAYIPRAETIGSNAFSGCTALQTVTINGKTKQQVMAMANYPFGLTAGAIIKCSDGNIPIKRIDVDFHADTSVGTSAVTVSGVHTDIDPAAPVAFHVNWGDGSAIETAYDRDTITHNYSNSGDYTIFIYGENISGLSGIATTSGFISCVDGSFSKVTVPATTSTFGNSAFYGMNCEIEIQGDAYLSSSSFGSALGQPDDRIVIAGDITNSTSTSFNYGSSSPIYVSLYTRTMAQVRALANYPWQLANGTTIRCRDGIIVVGE